MKKTTKILTAILSVLLVIIVGFSVFFFISISPVSNESNTIKIEIQEGMSTRQIINELKKENVIKNSDVALIYSKIFKNASFKAGTFEVDSSWGLDKLFEYLSNDQNIIDTTVNFTIYPGNTLRMIASNLQEVTNLNANELIRTWNNETFVKTLMPDYPFLTDELFNSSIVMKLEGYLFPDTYNIYKETTIEDVTRTFLNNTKKYYDMYANDFASSSLSINQIFTLASIIDYEASTAEDRKNVSSVFYNRLEIDMPLQSSVTRCYALSLKENRNINDWSECEIELDFESPYDTYQVYGLPPGPIRCISQTSLEAALKPNNTNYFYFIGDVCGDGTVYFSETYAQHNQYISEFLTKC